VIVFFDDSDPLSFSADIIANRASHEFGHLHGLADVESPNGNCDQTTTMMIKILQPTTPFTNAPTDCDSESAESSYGAPPGGTGPLPGGCTSDADCDCGGSCDKNGNCMNAFECSPILIPVGPGSMVRLTSPQTGVWFDLSGDGIPQRIAWTHAGDPVAFLVLDRNGNGTIDDGTELFGNHTILTSGQKATNGFEALAYYDRPGYGGNGDGVIDSRDAVWTQLQLWIDWNHNGVSESNELYDLEDFDVWRIWLEYREINRSDAYGNVFRLQAPCQVGPAIRMGYDVYFSARPQRRP
jgi:hypothetical protein